jgi:hypothetical protein
MPRDYHYAKRDILDSMPGTISEIIAKSGYERNTVERWMRRMRGVDCHVVDWRRPAVSGPFVPVYAAGPGEDAVCTLKPLTPSQDWERRKTKYGVDTLRAKERAAHWALKARRGQVVDPLMAALFGK